MLGAAAFAVACPSRNFSSDSVCCIAVIVMCQRCEVMVLFRMASKSGAAYSPFTSLEAVAATSRRSSPIFPAYTVLVSVSVVVVVHGVM